MLKKFLNKKTGLIVIIVLLLIAFFFINKKSKLSNEELITSYQKEERPKQETLIVQINGEVMKPGIYEIIAPARVIELVNLAGGFTSKADTNINLVAWLEDGSMIYINKINEKENNNKISLNNATLEELQTLPQIGLAKAQAIIDYRNKNGAFTNIDQLLKVNGISQNIFNNLKELISP